MTKEWNIPPGGEFRFEVDFGNSFSLKLTSGTAEIFGAELALEQEYTFSGQKLAIFSFDGATLTIVKEGCSVEYVSSESVSFPSFLNLHMELEKERATGKGPRVLVLGSGRNSLARTLCNYAVRMDGRPVWVSIDPRTNPLFFPGTLSAHSLNAIVEPEEPSMAGGMAAEGTSPLSLFFGSTATSDNRKLWLKMVERLALHVNLRLSNVQENMKTGCILVGPGEQDAPELSGALIEQIQNAFNITWIVVVGNERTHARLQRHFAGTPSLRVSKLPKSGGIVSWPRPGDWDRRYMHRFFNSYFYGPRQELNPFSQTLSFDSFSLYKILLGEEDIAPMSALPLGATRKLDECRAVRVEASTALILYSILAILHIPEGEDQSGKKKEEALSDALVNANVAGFLYVTGVEESRKNITVLSPCPGEPPSRHFVCGRLKWIE